MEPTKFALEMNRRRVLSVVALIAVSGIMLNPKATLGSAQNYKISEQKQITRATRDRTGSILAGNDTKLATADKPGSKLSNLTATAYLQKYRYMNSTKELGGSITPKVFYEAMIRFQHSLGLKETGIADEESLRTMAKPRCGNVEVPRKFEKSLRKLIPRRKRQVAEEIRLMNKTLLTYRISKYPKNFTRELIDEQIRKAGAVWSEVADVDFIAQPDGIVDIEVEFSRGDQEDAKLSSKSVKLHFDEGEDLTVNSDGQGVDIFQMAVHELGHALGLEHSAIPESIMFPVYRYNLNFKLHPDDIKVVQELYGKRGQ